MSNIEKEMLKYCIIYGKGLVKYDDVLLLLKLKNKQIRELRQKVKDLSTRVNNL